MIKHRLFSYGTLQLENVQLETYGRKLEGTPDTLIGYKLGKLEIKDEHVINKSGTAIHPVAIQSNDENDQINGVIFEITDEELLATDTYEVADYQRVLETFQSGTQAWVYIAR